MIDRLKVKACEILLVFLAASGCGEVHVVDTDASLDAAVDASEYEGDAATSDAGGLTLSSGRIATLGNAQAAASRFRIVDEGIEFLELACEGHICIRGGIVP